ncbi:mannose-6-phosphate isomerase, class I [Microbacterium timonense]|uniref:mannose-6-phosphate isomerase, class I n=1 Tax=Microbacterium timonense TaxID=2086576 RepID=UPI000D0F7584|nr:mannose-6-phosphate isomerase, class I [Microbacterium timonense]
MLIPLANAPRDYAWGSTSLLAGLEGRQPASRPEAEVWFGDHPGDPAELPDGRTLDRWIADEGGAAGLDGPLPYLLKLLAAASPLSIQAHPSKQEAEAGFAREDAAGIPRDAAERTYRDTNHKPELIVALSDTFRALAGLRDLTATRRLVAALGPGAAPLAEKLTDASLSDVIGWLLSDGSDVAREVIAAAVAAHSDEFAAELDLARALDEQFPGDPGIVVALLMNLVTLRRGEGLFLPAGVLHAYLEGLGVELMAASDNVLRGGLTPKHIDTAELVRVLDPTPGLPPIIAPRPVSPGVHQYDVPVRDFALLAVTPPALGVDVPLAGPAVAVVTAGAIEVTGLSTGASERLTPGRAALITPDEGGVRAAGAGDLFIALPGR